MKSNTEIYWGRNILFTVELLTISPLAIFILLIKTIPSLVNL